MTTFAGVNFSKRRNRFALFLREFVSMVSAMFSAVWKFVAGTAVRAASRFATVWTISKMLATTWVDQKLRFLTHSNLARSQIGALTVETVVGFVVVALVVALLIPIAINELTTVDTSGWDARLITIWELLPVMIGIGILLAIIFYFLKRGKR